MGELIVSKKDKVLLSYKGNFKDSKFSGEGTLKTSQTIYEGTFENSLKHGHGRVEIPSQFVYEGEWKEDKMDGQGKFEDLLMMTTFVG